MGEGGKCPNETTQCAVRPPAKHAAHIFRALADILRAALKKILEREDHYLNVARRTFTNFFLRVTCLHRASSNLNNKILQKKANISLLKISICILAKPCGRKCVLENPYL
jgi:hypothetical protein